MTTRKPRLVIDLTHLANPACGFGQIALNYARLFGEKARGYALSGLFPRRGADVQAPGFRRVPAPSDVLCRFFPFLLPKADVWHMPNQYCRLPGKARSTRVVLTIHDLNFLLERSEASARRRLQRLQKKVDRATVVVAISHYVESLVRKHLDLRGKDLRVIYDGVEELTSAPQEQPTFVRSGRPFFFAIGELRAKKNFETLIELMPHFPDHDLYLCGKDRTPEADAMRRRVAELGLTNVFLPGIISDPERVWLYAHTEALLFPSEKEGFGLPAIEAMQFGRPVFIADRASLPEICNGLAYVWKNYDPTDMAQVVREGLAHFVAHPERGEAERIHAARFGYAAHVDAYFRLYDELLRRD